VPRGLLIGLRVVGCLLAYLIVLSATSIGLYFFGLQVLRGEAQGTFGLVGLAIAEGLALATVLLFWRWVDRRPIVELGLRRAGARRQWLRGAAVATGLMGAIVVVGFTIVAGARWEVNPDLTRAALVLVAGFLGYAIQGPAEEVLFRGYVFENVRGEWGLWAGVAVSAASFALVHSANPSFGPLPLLNLLLFGVVTALYKVRVDAGQLWGVFALHTMWNWLQQVVFGLPNSGLTSVPENALFTVTPPSGLPEVLSSAFGPEGTVYATLALGALLVVLLRWKKPVSELHIV
jgi:membrane protease YdiL (CAAX protease family)